MHGLVNLTDMFKDEETATDSPTKSAQTETKNVLKAENIQKSKDSQTKPTYTKEELEIPYSLEYMEQRMHGLVNLTDMFKDEENSKDVSSSSTKDQTKNVLKAEKM